MLCEFGFDRKRLAFDSPIDIIQTKRLSDIPRCIEQMENALKQGLYLAGFFSYEAGYWFEETLRDKQDFDFPLLAFGVYRKPGYGKEARIVDRSRSSAEKRTSGIDTGIGPLTEHPFNISREEYNAKILMIQDHIAKGDTYQITFCVKKKFEYSGDTYSLYRKLLDYQRVPYPAYIKHKDFDILSLSPEMFLKKTNEDIVVKPMKGTWIRDRNIMNNIFGGIQLKFDPKNRAENVMIADLLRNDLGRIRKKGEVVTQKLFEVARYRTLYQMTSTVATRIDKNIPIYELFKALFPSGSVTGAPKIRSMQIIRELESEERRIYTGAIGYITPQRDMFFNVPIRTLLLPACRQAWPPPPSSSLPSLGEMGIGGGITWYSTPAGEYEECEIKSKFLDALL